MQPRVKGFSGVSPSLAKVTSDPTSGVVFTSRAFTIYIKIKNIMQKLNFLNFFIHKLKKNLPLYTQKKINMNNSQDAKRHTFFILKTDFNI